jgi:hypothetical protein
LPRPTFFDTVHVGPGDATITLTSAAAGANGVPGEPVIPNLNVSRKDIQLHDEEAPYTEQRGGSPSFASVRAARTGDHSWQLDLFARGHQEPVVEDGFRRFDLWAGYALLDVSIAFTEPPREGKRRLKMKGDASTDDWCSIFIRMSTANENKSVASDNNLGGPPTPPISNSLETTDPGVLASLRMFLLVPNRGFAADFVSRTTSCRGSANFEIQLEEDEPPPPQP